MSKRVLYLSLLCMGLVGIVGPAHSFDFMNQLKPPAAKTELKASTSKKTQVKVKPIRSQGKASFVLVVTDIVTMSKLAGFMDDNGVVYSSSDEEAPPEGGGEGGGEGETTPPEGGGEGETTPPEGGGEGETTPPEGGDEGEGGGKVNCEGWCDYDGDDIPDDDEIGPGADDDGDRPPGESTLPPASVTGEGCPAGVVIC